MFTEAVMIPFKRTLEAPDYSFFLFGPRGVGKSTWLKTLRPWDIEIDLLQSTQYLAFIRNPGLLRDMVGTLGADAWVWIDEVQKVPALLDEVHSLMESHKINFVLSGTSARKLKRQGANLLAGRAITRKLDALSSFELGDAFNLDAALEFGTLPLVVTRPAIRKDILKTYVATYLKEEIQEEGMVRKIEPFVRFLEVAALMNGQVVNMNHIATEAVVPRPSVTGYFSILTDTLLGHWVPSFRPRVKVRELGHPKFYWFDGGVARAAAALLDEPMEREWQGRALETFILHEIRCYHSAKNIDREISYYNTPSNLEIDFVITLQTATVSKKAKVILLEIKLSAKWDAKWEQAMRDLHDSGKVEVVAMYGIYGGDKKLVRNGVTILSVRDFLSSLFKGEIC